MDAQKNKLTAAIGTVATIDNCDLTAWITCGWALIESVDAGHVRVRKLR